MSTPHEPLMIMAARDDAKAFVQLAAKILNGHTQPGNTDLLLLNATKRLASSATALQRALAKPKPA